MRNSHKVMMLAKVFSLAWFKAAAAAIALIFLSVVPAVKAQPPGTTTQNPQTGNPSQVNWNEELKNAQEEKRALTSIIAAIESIDTARQNELIQWIITDRSIRSRVISALRKAGKNISPSTNADLQVTQKPPTDPTNPNMDLLRIVIESVGVYGTPQIKRILGEDLYNKINSRSGYELTLVESEQPQQRVQYANIDASIFGGDIIFKSGFGFGMNVGNDYIGYPFWLPGNFEIMGIIHKEMTDVRIGLNFPLGEAGLTPFVLSGGLRIKQRKLEGTQGFQAEVNQMLNVVRDPDRNGRLSIGGEWFQSFVPNINTFSLRASTDSIYRSNYPLSRNGLRRDSLFYIGLTGHAWLTYSFGESLRGAYVQLGAGTHRINASTVAQPMGVLATDLKDAGSFSYFDPLIKLGYNHTAEGGYDYGMYVQYCNELLADAYVRIFSWLNLEVKYAAVVFRDPQKWELTDFFIITPVLKLNF